MDRPLHDLTVPALVTAIRANRFAYFRYLGRSPQAERNDDDAPIALLSWRSRERASYEDVLTMVTNPCLPHVGEDADEVPAVRVCASRMPDATLVAVPGFGHEVVFCSDVMVPHISAFLQAVGNNTA